MRKDVILPFLLSMIVFLLPITIAFAQEENIVINEIMYDPPNNENTEEWVELYHKGTNSISLKNWGCYDGTTRTLTLISGTLTIPPGSYAVLTENPGTFTSNYPTFTGTLIKASPLVLNNNDGDTLCMITPAGIRIGSVTYDSSWGAADNGNTLEKIYPAGDNTPSNWGQSKVTGGTPGRSNSLTPIPPTITITHPFSPGAQADNSYLIGWQDDDADSNATITLYYDTNNTGTDGIQIVTGISEDDETDYYQWNTSPLPQGNSYYIYAKIEDGVNPPVYNYSSGAIIIDRRQHDGKTLPWRTDGLWLIGDIHLHTKESDGSYPAGTVAQYATNFGADFIAITDHADNINTATYHTPIVNARKLFKDLVIFEGIEWNVPGAGDGGHAVVLVTNSPREHEIISSFTTNFDSVGTNSDAVAGLQWLETCNTNGVIPICSLNHPSRPTGVNPEGFRLDQLRMYDNAGGVCIGFSGDVGHKRASDIISYAQLVGGYHDPKTAFIGHHWDTLLDEGRSWWIRFESDFHSEGWDYFPIEFTQTRVYCPSKTYEGVIKGLRAGCTYAVHKNIITDLEFLGISGTQTAMMGEVIQVTQGDIVTASIRVRPSTGTTIDKIELISNVAGTPTSTKVFSSSDWTVNGNWLEMSYVFTNVQNDFYFRVRGSSSTGSPVDLWFYSNPIRVAVVRSILISPTAGTVGTVITISGTGFHSTEYIRIDFGTIKRIHTTWANEQGSFSTTFKVHFQPAGIKTVSAIGVIRNTTVTTTFEVTSSGSPPVDIKDLTAVNPTAFSVTLKAGAWVRDYAVYLREREAVENLNAIRSALEAYYKDNNGQWPANLTALIPYYLQRIPEATLQAINPHNNSNKVTIVTTAFDKHISASKITDAGGWIYSPNSGDIKINCNHQDSGEFLAPPHYREYYKYAHEDDDGFIGMNTFDIRYSTSPITESNWSSANKCEKIQLPYIFLILGLQSESDYYFACKEMDERGNWSSLSNVIKIKTIAESEGVTSNLTALDPTSNSMMLTWTPLCYINRVREKQTELNLMKLKEAIHNYYKDNFGQWPNSLDVLIPTYLISIPLALLQINNPHNDSNKVIYVTTAPNDYISSDQITDAGGWIYSRDSGDIRINCSHKDTADREYYKYLHEVTGIWTTPTGTPTTYEIRYSTSTITEGNWIVATPITGIISARGGIAIAYDLLPETIYYFGLKSLFEGAAWSLLSNIATCTTTEAFYFISDLSATNSTTSSITLKWTSVPIADKRLGVVLSNLNILNASINSYLLDTCGIYPLRLDTTPDTFNMKPIPAFIPGYLNNIPTATLRLANLHNNSNTVTYTTEISTSTITDIGGWIYDSDWDDNDIRINCSHSSNEGVTYFTYKPNEIGKLGTFSMANFGYDIRYSTKIITEANWEQAIPVATPPIPNSPGSQESFTITGLQPNTTYYFAIKTIDELGSNSQISNIATGTTIGTPPVPLLIFTKRVTPAGTISIGGTLTYTLYYENVGAGTATNVVLIDEMPAGTIYITDSATGANTYISYSHDGGLTYDSSQDDPVTHIRWEIRGVITPRGSGEVRFEVRIK